MYLSSTPLLWHIHKNTGLMQSLEIKTLEVILKKASGPTISPLSFDSGNVDSNGGIHCSAHSQVVLQNNGDFEFTGSFRNTDFVPYDIAFGWVIASKSGTALTFSMSGHISNRGIGSPAANHDWRFTGSNSAIVDAWNALEVVRVCGYRAGVKTNLGGIIDSIVAELNRDGWIINDIIDIVSS
jgi:hypothetical protein